MAPEPTIPDPLPLEQVASSSSSNLTNDLYETYRALDTTVVDFFVTDQEVATVIEHPSIYDVVYGIRPDTIMQGSYDARLQQPPSFRWIHLPVNYMALVEDLMKQISFSINMEALEHYCLAQHAALRGIQSMPLSCETLPGDFTPDLAERFKKFMLFMPMLSLESYSVFKNFDLGSLFLQRQVRAKQHLVANYLRPLLPSENPNPNANPEFLQFLHFLPQTLDGYLDPGIMDTARYDLDQIVHRYLAENSMPLDHVLIVDRLWLWNDSQTIITCFWQNSLNDEISHIGNIIRSLYSAVEEPIRSPNALALLIARKCTDIFEQSSEHHDNVLEIFRATIRQIRQKWEQSETSFWRNNRHQPHNVGAVTNLRDLDTNTDIMLVAQSDDIHQELLIMMSVFSDQSEVMKSLAKFTSRNEVLPAETTEEAGERIYEKLHSIVASNIKDLSRLDTQVRKVQEKLNSLISLKDSHLTQWEGNEAAKQGQAVLIFTIFTMVFLPSSFMAAFFAIPIKQLPTDSDGSTSLSLSYVIKYMMTFTLAVFVPSILLAFNSWRLSRWKQRLLNEINRRFKKPRQKLTDGEDSG